MNNNSPLIKYHSKKVRVFIGPIGNEYSQTMNTTHYKSCQIHIFGPQLGNATACIFHSPLFALQDKFTSHGSTCGRFCSFIEVGSLCMVAMVGCYMVGWPVLLMNSVTMNSLLGCFQSDCVCISAMHWIAETCRLWTLFTIVYIILQKKKQQQQFIMSYETNR